MENFIKGWKELKTSEKVVILATMACSVGVIVLAIIHILGIWDDAINVYVPLTGVISLLQAIQNWKRARVAAIFSLCAAIFVFAVTIFIWVMRVF